MSRNLLRTSCARCSGVVRLLEAPRLVTMADAGVYFDEYEGMKVANADCSWCGARYIAWVTAPPSWSTKYGYSRRIAADEGFYDLSFRSTFDDEPGPDDLPAATVTFEAGQLYPR